MLRILSDSRFLKLMICACGLLACTTPDYAWNGHGHRTIASAAWRQLTPTTRVRAMDLLRLNPYYAQWSAKVPASASGSERDELIFIQASTWADDIKDRSSGYYSDPCQDDSPIPSDYSDKRRHTYWHFRDVPFSTDGTPLPAVQTPNAETEIVRHRQTLASASATDAQRSYAMVWLIHLVADIHQPLHAASRISRDFPQGDMGGNKVLIKGARARTLHAFWDDILGASADITAAPKLASTLPAAGTAAAVMDEKQWVQESFRIAVEKVYGAPIGDGPGPFLLDENYKTAAFDVSAKQASLAGVRLANILNNELPASATVAPSPVQPTADQTALYVAIGAVVALVLLSAGLLLRLRRR